MIYIAAFLTVVLIALRWTAPKRHAVHASRAQPLPFGVKPGDVYVGGDFLLDESGARIETRGKFVGKAVRESMSAFGIPDGSTFVADYLGSDEKARLGHGDIVVIDGAAAHSETGFRLRVIDRINPDRTVSFQPDGFGNERRARPLSEVVAKVTHVADQSASARVGIAWGFLSRLFASRATA